MSILASDLQQATISRGKVGISADFVTRQIDRALVEYLNDPNRFDYEVSVEFAFEIGFRLLIELQKIYIARGFGCSTKTERKRTTITINWRVIK
jgi:hypothetical protein